MPLTIFDSTLQTVDYALQSASEAGTETSEVANQKFELAADMLHGYGAEWHPRNWSCEQSKFLTAKERITAAKEEDRLFQKKTWKEKLLKQVRFRHANPISCSY